MYEHVYSTLDMCINGNILHPRYLIHPRESLALTPTVHYPTFDTRFNVQPYKILKLTNVRMAHATNLLRL